MAIRVVDGLHIRVTCDGCRRATAELCGRRDLEVTARRRAVVGFRKAGWHNDPAGPGGSFRPSPEDGDGRWYCPDCAKRTHL